MSEKQYNISELPKKIENNGVTSQGRLSAAEFNLLVNAAIESQERISFLEECFTPISETEYEKLQEEGKLEERPYFIYED